MEETNFSRSNITGQEEASHATGASEPKTSSGLVGSGYQCERANNYPNHEEGFSYLTEPTKKSYSDKVKPITLDGFRNENQIWDLMIRPIKFLSFPVVFYTGFSYGATLVWLAMMNATESVVLSGAPYHFSTSIIGVTFLSPLIGSTLA